LGFIGGVLITLFLYAVEQVSRDTVSPAAHESLESLFYTVSSVGAALEALLGWTHTYSTTESVVRHLCLVSVTNGLLLSAGAGLLGWLLTAPTRAAPSNNDDTTGGQITKYPQRGWSVLAWSLLGLSFGVCITLSVCLLARAAPGGENPLTGFLMLIETLVYVPAEMLSKIFGIPLNFNDFAEGRVYAAFRVSLLNGIVCGSLTGFGVPLLKWILKHE
jgi:hypothetical protein